MKTLRRDLLNQASATRDRALPQPIGTTTFHPQSDLTIRKRPHHQIADACRRLLAVGHRDNKGVKYRVCGPGRFWFGGHTQRYHAHHGTTGYGRVYQGHYKSVPVQDDDHFQPSKLGRELV